MRSIGKLSNGMPTELDEGLMLRKLNKKDAWTPKTTIIMVDPTRRTCNQVELSFGFC